MKILSTKNYDQFKTIIGNRPVEVNHVNHLVSLNSKENLLSQFPGTVTKDGYLFDGQHRLAACKANDWEFFYTVSDKTLEELGDTIVALTNTAQKKWNIPDFIHYFTSHGKEQYVFLTQLMDTYKIAHTNLLVLVSGASQVRAIKRGELKMFTTEEDKQVVIELLDGFKLLQDVVPRVVWTSKVFATACRTVFGSMSAEEMKDEIIRSNVTLERTLNAQDQLRKLEDVVNYRKKESNHIRFF